jgi:hypothetical protein
VAELDLSRTRSLPALLWTTFGVWFRHFPVFFALALIPVVPNVVLIDGLWVGRLDDPNATGDVLAATASYLLSGFIVPSVVTAVHVIAVQDLGHGRHPSIVRSMRTALPLILPLSLVLLLYGLALVLGLILLIVGAIYFGVRYYFAAQALVVDGRRGWDALTRSGEMVEGHWWRVFAIAAFIFVVATILGAPLYLIDDGTTYIAAAVPLTALSLSYTALAGTILFFDLRARKGVDPALSAPRRDRSDAGATSAHTWPAS